MKLVVGIDGESYTELSHAFVETWKEAFEWVKEDVRKYDGSKTEKVGDKIYTQYTPTFHVHQLFDIDESKPFIVVHWHAYEGVDFDIKQFNTYKEARKYMNDTVTDVVANNEDYIIDWFNDKGACVDVKKEWMMWRIVEGRRTIIERKSVTEIDDTISRQAVEHLDLFTKTYCRVKSITDDLAFRCKQCEFGKPNGKCLVKVMARELCPDYKDFGAMGDL